MLGVQVVLFDPAFMSKEIMGRLGFGPLGHAEEVESSHMWHCHPELYHADRAKDYIPSTVQGMAKSVEVANGTTGSPTKACREKGKEYHEHLVARLVQVVEQLKPSTVTRCLS